MHLDKYKYLWSMYFSLEGNAPNYKRVKAIFQSLLGQLGGGELIERPATDWDGNPRDGYRRPVYLEGTIENKWHFHVWAGTEWRGESQYETRFEFPIKVYSNLPWEQEAPIWQWLSKMMKALQYRDRMFDTYSVRNLVERLEAEGLQEEADKYRQMVQKN